MKETRIVMGMPVTVAVVDGAIAGEVAGGVEENQRQAIDAVFTYFEYVDGKFSTYKEQSEISLINRREVALEAASADMQTVFALCEETKHLTNGYFDIVRQENHHTEKNGDDKASADNVYEAHYDPSGLVKGWAIDNAAAILRQMGFANFYVEAGGDVQAVGKNEQGEAWRVGIRNPFVFNEIVKVLAVSDCGVASSGSYVRGQHIYNPKEPNQPLTAIVSLTVIGPDVYEADRFATAAFAMGAAGIAFIEQLEGFEGYMINCQGQATFTSGFARYVNQVCESGINHDATH